MDGIQSEIGQPRAAAAGFRTLAELESGLMMMSERPRDSGRLTLIVRRIAEGVRETPGRARLCVEEGLPGDAWGRRADRYVDAQLAVMRDDVARLIANGQPLTLFGDNLFVDLDISEANLPLGTRLRIGGAVVEVTPKPHTGCSKFHNRFGADALRFVNAPAHRGRNLRGIYWRVVESGDVNVNGLIQVVSRPVMA